MRSVCSLCLLLHGSRAGRTPWAGTNASEIFIHPRLAGRAPSTAHAVQEGSSVLMVSDFVGQAVFEGDPTALPGSEVEYLLKKINTDEL